jgi:4-amino-4-deoxy-L-arabinose transferase-like glycosyltransferase
MVLTVVVFFVSLASISFMVRDRVPWEWDEAEYINRAFLDRAAIRLSPKAFIGRLLKEDVSRPPAYRMLHVPFTLAAGVSAPELRIVSFAGLLLTLWLVYLAVNELAGTSAGIFAILFILPLPAVLGPVTSFGTEHVLYIAVAGSLWSLVRMLRNAAWRRCLLLGCFLALGLLAKVTFVTVAAPLLLVVALARAGGFIERPRITDLATAIAIAIVVVLPWYALNVRSALWYAQYASQFVRHSLPYSSPFARTLAFVALIVESGFGYGLAALGVVTLCLALRRRSRMELKRDRTVALFAMSASVLGALGIQLVSHNHNPRFTAPALILIGAALGILAGASSLVRSRGFFALSCCLIFFQLGLVLTHWPYDALFTTSSGSMGQPPSALFQRDRGWDWQKLRTLCRDRFKDNSDLRIGSLGSGGYFNPPQITHPWAEYAAAKPWVAKQTEDTWLWRYEDGPLDWRKLFDSLDRYDVLLTAPDLLGDPSDKEDLDNKNNSEFVRRLEADPRFSPPVVIRPVEDGPDVYVYFRRSVR